MDAVDGDGRAPHAVGQPGDLVGGLPLDSAAP